MIVKTCGLEIDVPDEGSHHVVVTKLDGVVRAYVDGKRQ